jgi:hypothetical protein
MVFLVGFLKVAERQARPPIAGAIGTERIAETAIFMVGLCFLVRAVSSRSLQPVNRWRNWGLAGACVLAIQRGRPQAFKHAERWQSGRSRRTRNAKYAQAYRGFESLPLRHEFKLPR